MDVREFLKRYRLAGFKAELLRNEIAELEAEAEGRAIAPDGMPHAPGPSDPAGNLAARIADEKDRLFWLLSDQNEIRREIESVLFRLEDADQFRVMKLKYIDGLQWMEIAGKMDLSPRQAQRKHGEALEEVRRLMDEEV